MVRFKKLYLVLKSFFNRTMTAHLNTKYQYSVWIWVEAIAINKLPRDSECSVLAAARKAYGTR